MAKKVIIKNSCTPQERVDFAGGGNRWYLDSDCGRKLSGSIEETLGAGNVNYVADVAISSSIAIGAGNDFIFIKNLGGGTGSDIDISLDNGATYGFVLSSGEAFASKLDPTYASIKITTSGDSTIQYFTGT